MQNVLRGCKSWSVSFVAVLMTGAVGTWAQNEPAPAAENAPRPTALKHAVQPLEMIRRIETPPIDIEAVWAEDDLREQQGLPPRFAIPHEVSITPDTHGTWEELDASTRLWRLRVSCPEALSVNLGFTRYHMPPGGQLMIYSADHRYVIRPFTETDNEEHGQLWTPVVLSSEIVVELTIPRAVEDRLELELTRINHGYRGFGRQFAARSGACNVDVVCPEGDPWRDEIGAVGVISTGGSTFCTGFMVNNTAQDLTPYFMTANHCGIYSGNAASLVVYWNYQNSWCRPPGGGASGGPGDGTLNQFNTGSFWRSGYSASDFTLVELDSDPNPSFEVSFAGWDRTSANPTSAVCIHHPNTDEKRISFEYDPCTTTSYLGYSQPGDSTHIRVADWDLGTTEPGSSGSPLFDQDHHVVGQLHGGYAACGNNDSDWYGRFSVSWNGGGSSSSRLRDWLDPGNTGASSVNTIPGGGMIVDPSGDVLHVGVVGGPFTNPTTTYTLTNPTPNPVNYRVSLTSSFGILLDGGTTPVTGTLSASGGTAQVVVTLGPDINNLPEGTYTEVINFEDLTNARTLTRQHVVEVGTTAFTTEPDYGLEAGGPVGGPFTATVTYTLTSTRPTPVDVEVAASDSWIAINGGTAPVIVSLNGIGDSTNVVIGFSSDADQLPPGIVTGQVTFRNLMGGAGDTSRPVTLDVGRFSYPSTDTPIAINDNTTIYSYITVTDAYCIGDVDVEVDITHTWIGDLIVELRSPEGTVVRLHNRSGGSADDIVTTYDDATNPPDGPGQLADFNTESPAGTWRLMVSDNASQDTGTLNSWRLRISAGGPGCDPIAMDVNVQVPHTVTSPITLNGISPDGSPLDYIITSLPTNGTISDPNGGTIAAVPYTLIGNGKVVNYQPDAQYVGTDSFQYKVNDGQNDSNIATVNITVGGPQVIYDFPLDTDPGWSRQGVWQFGQPTGGGSYNGDPTSGYTGTNVYGYNLNGDYTNNIPRVYLTTTALDLSDVYGVTLEFRRWLGVEAAQFDGANIDVSNNGADWVTVWEHSGAAVSESAWWLQSYDLSAVADNQSTVYVRWGMGPTDLSVTYPGWNIDDVQIIGILPPPGESLPGDLDSDGDVDLADFITFAGCYSGDSVTVPPPGCNPTDFDNADLDTDNDVDLVDFITFAGNFTG